MSLNSKRNWLGLQQRIPMPGFRWPSFRTKSRHDDEDIQRWAIGNGYHMSVRLDLMPAWYLHDSVDSLVKRFHTTDMLEDWTGPWECHVEVHVWRQPKRPELGLWQHYYLTGTNPGQTLTECIALAWKDKKVWPVSQ